MSRKHYILFGGVCVLLALVVPLLAQRGNDHKRTRGRAAVRYARSAKARVERSPKVIELGWDQPNTSELKEHLADYEKAPFDGLVLSAVGWEGSRRIDLMKVAFGREGFTRTQFQTAVNQLRGTHFKKLTDNFLRFNVTPGNVDWFDDAGWDAIVKNAGVASWICKEGKLKGIMFDTEMYKGAQNRRIFYYQEQTGKGSHSFEEYRDQARKRGREFGAALASEKSDITVLITFATSFMSLEEKAPPPYALYGLLPPFIDGMMDATRDATFVDGLELAYNVRDRSQFEHLHQVVEESRKHSLNPGQYRDRMQVGFGLWLDKDWGERGWDPDNTAKNYYQPDEFQKTLEAALSVTDKYVWVYSQKVNWWTGKGMSDKYVKAIENARARVASRL